MNLRLLVSLLCAGIFVSCAPKQNDPFHTRGGSFWDMFSGLTHYQSLFDDRTQEVRTHSEFESIMTAYITLWDAPLRKAYVEEMRSQLRLSAEQTKALNDEQLSDEKKYYIFILSVATREPSWADFNKKNSMWRLTLENEDASIQVDPELPELIPVRDEKAKYFYRHMTTFTSTYKVRFSRDSFKNQKIAFFHIAGPKGALSAKFSIDAASDDR